MSSTTHFIGYIKFYIYQFYPFLLYLTFMYQFKPIALVPLRGTSSEFIKNLKPGIPYQFYQGYTLKNSNDEITSVYKNDERQDVEDLYTLKNGLNLSISAVVGENGSGKSALFELLYYMIYKMSITDKEKGGMQSLEDAARDLRRQRLHVLRSRIALANLLDIDVNNSAADEFEGSVIEPYELNEKQNITGVYLSQLVREFNLFLDTNKISNSIRFEKEVLRQLMHKADAIGSEIRNAMLKENLLDAKFNVSLIYESSNGIFETNCKDGIVNHFKFGDTGKEAILLDIENFFYTISLNYSHHGLNSKTLGQWITKLFHKNDAYRTPVVISPMRTDGNYEINNELKLSRERLMNVLAFDLVKEKTYNLLGKYNLTALIFKPKKSAYPLPFGDSNFTGLRSAELLKGFDVMAFEADMPYIEEAVAYLEEKMFKIEFHYRDLITRFGQGKTQEQALLSFILEENTHATKKIRQTLHYLNKVTNRLLRIPLPELNKNGEMVMWASDFRSYISNYIPNAKNASPTQVAEYAMPGFVSVDFEFEVDFDSKVDESDTIRLSKLSSGEQQMIFNINTIIYHIYNLASVHKGKSINARSGSNTFQDRNSFGNINIVLDEIELYYHPEMQRQVIKNLVSSFEKMANPTELGIQSINVCILTHSPFILSDIPVQNTLRMDQGEPILGSEQTFGANIHELLHNDFFLESFVGEFTKARVDHVVRIMDEIIKLKKRSSSKGISSHKELFFQSQEQCRKIINLIGEPVLYVSLMEMFEEAFGEQTEDYIAERLQLIIKQRGR